MPNTAEGLPRRIVAPGSNPDTPKPAPVEIPSRVRRIPLKTSLASKLADTGFRYAMLACSLSVLIVVALLLYELITKSRLTIAQFGFKFFTGSNWDPVAGDFGAFPFIYGTIVSSLLALVIAVPLAIGVDRS